ncbi:hypothetical protein [Nocardioides pacificus]
MKKLIAGILSAFLMTFGLVAFSGAPASAEPYPDGTPTETEVKPAPPSPGQKPRITVNVDPVAGQGAPRGHVFITFVRRDGKFTYSFKRFTTGDSKTFVFPKVKKAGRYVVTVTFVPNTMSSYAPSSNSFNLWVPNR